MGRAELHAGVPPDVDLVGRHVGVEGVVVSAGASGEANKLGSKSSLCSMLLKIGRKWFLRDGSSTNAQLRLDLFS